jgi:ADP-heptose:LPS heptosyltransferase
MTRYTHENFKDDACARNLLVRAEALLEQREVGSAVDAFREAEAHGADRMRCAAGRWTCWMLLGRFTLAWRESENIEAQGFRDKNSRWNGRPFEGRHVLIRGLHGLGDTIQFIRYAQIIRERAAHVTVQTHPELVELIADIQGVDEAITWPDPPGLGYTFDQELEIMELPLAFRTTLESIPSLVPYIKIDPGRVDESDRKLGPRRLPRIGLLWAASNYDATRNIPLESLTPLLRLKAFNFFSFQRSPQRHQLRNLGAEVGIRDISSLGNTIDTAANMVNMDLIITVDTFGAHLAGALGRPVFLMLPFRADWRWMLNRTDTPWYPTMRLFRQPRDRDWDSVVQAILSKLTD